MHLEKRDNKFLKKFCRSGIEALFRRNYVGKFSDVFQTFERFSDTLQEYSTVVNGTANIVNYLFFKGKKAKKNGSPGGDRQGGQRPTMSRSENNIINITILKGSAKKRERSPLGLFFEEYQRYTDQCQPECDGNDEFSNQQQQADEQ